MKAYQATYPVRVMSRVLKVSASGFYAWLLRLPSEHARSDVVLGDRIEAISRRSRSTYGRPRIPAELADEGIRVGGKRVARLMRNRSICGASRRKTIVTTIRDRAAKPAPDLVDRRFTAGPRATTPYACACPVSSSSTAPVIERTQSSSRLCAQPNIRDRAETQRGPHRRRLLRQSLSMRPGLPEALLAARVRDQ